MAKALVASLIFLLSFSSKGQDWKKWMDSAGMVFKKNQFVDYLRYWDNIRNALAIDSPQTGTYATACNYAGVANHILARYDVAENLYWEAKYLRERLYGSMDSIYCMILHNLGSLYLDLGQYEKSEPFFLESISVRLKLYGPTHVKYAIAINHLAGLYLSMGQYENSERLYLEAKDLYEKIYGKESIDYGTTCNLLGFLYHKMGLIDKAEVLYKDSKRIIEKTAGKESGQNAYSCNSIGLFYHDTKQFEKAEESYLEAKWINAKLFGTNHPYYAVTCHNLGLLYATTGNYAKAEEYYLEAKKIREASRGKSTPEYALNCDVLGRLYQYMGQYEKAEKLHLEAKEIREQVLGKLHSSNAIHDFNLFAVYWAMGQFEKADYYLKESFNVKVNDMNNFFQFTNENERMLFIKNISSNSDWHFTFYNSYNQHAGQAYTSSIFYRNLVLSAAEYTKNSIYSSNDTLLTSKYKQWVNLRRQLAYWYSKPISLRKVDLRAMESNANSLEKELGSLSSSFNIVQKRKDISWQTIQSKLKTDECAIEFFEYDYQNGWKATDSTLYGALLLRKDLPEPILIPLCNKSQLDSVLGGRNSASLVNRIYYAQEGGNELYRLTWKPLEEHLTHIKTIYYAPAGLLHRVSFAAIPVNRTELLCDRYSLIQLTTTSTVTEIQQEFIKPNETIRLYGGITYHADSVALKRSSQPYYAANRSITPLPTSFVRNGDWNNLPGTLKEIEAIENLGKPKGYRIQSFKGVKATEETFKSMDGKSSPSIIHVATHGFFFPDPLKNKKDEFQKNVEFLRQSDNPLYRSGLLFAGAAYAWSGKNIPGIEDGILIAYEISNMYLPNTKLVVLSACETGLGDIQGSEGVFGLQRAFKMAGVKNMIMSLWSVPDNTTAEFMQLFYEQLFSKHSISESFSTAQIRMKNKYKGQPFKWAGMVLVR